MKAMRLAFEPRQRHTNQITMLQNELWIIMEFFFFVLLSCCDRSNGFRKADPNFCETLVLSSSSEDDGLTFNNNKCLARSNKFSREIPGYNRDALHKL